jgi:hypothetical protein
MFVVSSGIRSVDRDESESQPTGEKFRSDDPIDEEYDVDDRA